MKKLPVLLLSGALALLLCGCPATTDSSDTPPGTEQNEGDTENETGNENNDETGGDTGETGSEEITGTLVTAVSNCVFFIEGDRFTASGDYSTDIYSTKHLPVTLASSSDNQIEPVGEAIVFTRPFSGDTRSLYYLVKARNASSEDFKWVYARSMKFFDDDSSFTASLDGTLKGHLREIDTDSQTSHNIGLRPGDNGYFFSLSPGRIDVLDFESLDRAELTTSLELNEGSNSHTEVEAEITVTGYRYGEREGTLGLEISIENSGDTPVQLNRNPRIILMDGEEVSLFHGSFTRFPSGGLIQPGETGGYFQSASDLGNASADKVMLIIDYQDPPR